MRSIIYTIRLAANYLISAVIFPYSLTIGLFTRKGRRLLRYLCDYYGIKILPEKEVSLHVVSPAALVANKEFTVVEPKDAWGNVTLHELAVIDAIIAGDSPKAIFEIGTFDGRTTMNLAANSPDGCQVLTLDLPPEKHSDARYKINDNPIGKRIQEVSDVGFPAKKKIRQLFGDSAEFDFSPYYNSIDVIFIDGAHSYEHVTGDSNVALKLLRDGKGTILWHDYKNGIDITRAIDEFARKNPQLNMRHIEGTKLVCAMIN